jgi:putative MATE family efflux protein
MSLFLTPGWITFYLIIILCIVVAVKMRARIVSPHGLLEGSIVKGIIRYTLPLLIGSLFQQFYNLVDSIVVGRLIGASALAAVSLSGTLMWFIISFFNGIAMGVGVIIAQYYGAHDELRLQQAVNTTLIMFALAGLALGVIGLVLTKPILLLMKTPPEVLSYAVAYTRVIFGGFAVMATYLGISIILQSSGDSTTPFIFLAVSTIVNIVLDILFIAHFKMGVGAVAVATIISQFVAMTGCLIRLLNHENAAIRLHFTTLKFNKEIAAKAFRLGIPSGLQQTMQSLGFLMQTGMISLFGAAALAANGAISRIDGLLLLPAFNFSGTASTFTGQNIGAGQIDRVRHGIFYTMLISMGLTIILIIPTIIFRYPILQIFLDAHETETIHYGSEFLKLALWGYPFTTLSFVLMGTVRGAGQTKIPLYISLIGLWGIRLPVAYFLSQHTSLGLNGIWLASPIHWFVTALLGLLYFIFGNWQKAAIVKKPVAEAATSPD